MKSCTCRSVTSYLILTINIFNNILCFLHQSKCVFPTSVRSTEIKFLDFVTISACKSVSCHQFDSDVLYILCNSRCIFSMLVRSTTNPGVHKCKLHTQYFVTIINCFSDILCSLYKSKCFYNWKFGTHTTFKHNMIFFK